MKTRRLGGSGLEVSTMCFGAMTLGEPDPGSMMHGIATDRETSFSLLDRLLASGVNFIDVADVYGNDGLSERVLGEWLEKSGKRDEVVVATKFRFRMKPGPNQAGGARIHIMRAVEGSLKRLRTDRIDLYQIHCQDLDTPEEETLRALDDLVHQGKVLYLGASNYAGYRLVDSLWTSRSLGLSRFVALQMAYSLVERGLEREHVPICRQFGLGILPYSPLGGGFLTGKVHRGEKAPDGTRLAKHGDRLKRFDTDRHWAILAAVEGLAAELGTTASAVALAWLMAKPCVTSVIFGARSHEQLDDNLKAAELVLPPEAVQRLDQVSAMEWGYPYDMLGRLQGRW